MTPAARPWPLGARFECGRCQGAFRVESEAQFTEVAGVRPDGQRIARMACPSCASTVRRVYRPTPPPTLTA